VQKVPVYVYPSRGERFRSFAKAFVLGAAAAAVVTVGVVAELGEGPPTPQEPAIVPPQTAAPTPAPKVAAGADAPARKTPKPAAGRTGSGGAAAQKKAQTTGGTKTQRAAAKKTPSARSGAASRKSARKTQKPAATTPATTTEPKRFAWAPVDGAVGYRLELFRGDKQVLEAQTKVPAYELANEWRHAGNTERLTAGEYRWYVWPVFRSGPAGQAVVQARLTVP
jgi:hypothetical protein